MQVAELVGERGATLLLAIAAALLASGARRLLDPRARRLAGIEMGAGLLVPCAMAAWGTFRMDAIAARRHDALHATIRRD